MERNIDELTQKLLKEGVEKGQAQADKIIAEAKEETSRIVAQARAEAADIQAKGKKDVSDLEANTKSELKMFTSQALNALKTEIANVVSGQVVEEAVKAVVDDKTFMEKLILQLAERWSGGEELVISSDDADALRALFAKKAKKMLDNGVKIAQVNGQKAAFSISPADGSYRVDFGEEQFVDYFKSFLRPQLVEMLF